MSVQGKRLRALYGATLLAFLLGPPLAAPVTAAEEVTTDEEVNTDAGGSAADATDETPNWRETTLSGDWGGSRKRLYDAGVQADLVYSADYLRDTTGGLKRGGAYMGHFDLILQFDGEKLVGWQGGSAYLQLISNSGGRVNLNHVGSLMGVDNLEAPVNRTGIFKAWLQQSFLDDKASLRVGLYPIDSEFYITDSSGVFLHPSFGMAAEVASFGSLAGPSIYPTSSYAARLRIDPDPAWYAMVAVARGIPSERIATAGPNVSWQKGTGSMLIGEVGFSPVQGRVAQRSPHVRGKRRVRADQQAGPGAVALLPTFS
jgi:porin